MYKNKKMLAVLSTAAITGLLLATVSSKAFAKTTAIAVNSNDSKVYEYQYDALTASATSQLIYGSDNPGAKLYNDFLQRKTTVRACYDDIKKSYIEYDAISKEELNCMQKGNSFNLNSFTESASTPTINLTTNAVSVDSSGDLLINGQTIPPTVDMTTIKCDNLKNTSSTLVSFKLSVSNPEDYTVTVKGKTASMDSPTGTFTVFFDGKISISDIKNSDFSISKKTLSDKPTVKKVTTIDNETIRVCFNKKVDYNYATNISNYQLLNKMDISQIDISNHISGIYSAISQSDTQNTDTYDIKLRDKNPSNENEDWRLNDSKYTLEIRNVIDTSSVPNAMDTYTCVLDTDFTAPTITGIYKNISTSSNNNKVIVYFSEAMNEDTIGNKNNYKIVDGLGNTRPLPEDATIIIGRTSKSARIEFPSTYHIMTNATQNTGNSTDIIGLIVSNVKDKSEKTLNNVSYKSIISQPVLNETYVKNNSINAYYDKNDLIIDMQFSRELCDINSQDFSFGGVKPDSAVLIEDKLVLRFTAGSLPTASEIAAHPITYSNGKANTSPTKIDIIKAQGLSAKLAISPNSLADETGASVAYTLSDDQSKIYDCELGPKTAPNYWSATKESDGVKVYITFDTPLYINSGTRPDDFTFTSTNGKNLLADSVNITGSTLVFNFKSTNENYALLTNSVNVRCKDTISLMSMHDSLGNYRVYVPSKDDLNEKTIKITQ